MNLSEAKFRVENAFPPALFTSSTDQRAPLRYALDAELTLALDILSNMDETDWRSRQDWQPLPLRMTRENLEAASMHRNGKRHDVRL